MIAGRTIIHLLTPLLLAAVLLGACDQQDEIRVYQAPKDPPAAAVRPAQAESAPPAAPDIHWSVPDTWQPAAGDQPMRLATFHAGDNDPPLEIAVTRFPGDVGGMLANINRWREQLALPPITAEQLDEHVSPLETPYAAGQIVQISAEAREMLAAVIPTADGQTLFVRAVAAPAQIARHRAEILSFASSIHLASDHGHSPAPEAPHGPGELPSAGQPSFEPASPEIHFDIPDEWTAATRESAIVYAAFSTGDGDSTARITITPLHGGGGALLPNVNMWRNQIGLPPLDAVQPEQTRTIAIAGLNATLVDAARPGELSPAGLDTFVAIVPFGERTWYIRLTGDAIVVEAQRPQFEQFLQSLRFIGEPDR